MIRLSLITATLMMIVPGLAAQDLKIDMGDSVKVIKEGPDLNESRHTLQRSPASLGFETVDPFHTTWDKTPWPDEHLNFPPTGRSLPAGDLTGNGEMDLYRTYTHVPDERDDDYTTTTDKTLLFPGVDSGTEPDLVVYEELTPVGDLNGDGSGNAMTFDEESEAWYLYSFTENDYSREQFNHSDFETIGLGRSRIAHHDLNDSGYDDLVIPNQGEIYILYGADTPEEMTVESHSVWNWAGDHNVHVDYYYLKDLFRLQGEPYVVLGALDVRDSHRNAFILSIGDDDRFEVEQVLHYSHDAIGNRGLLQARYLAPDEDPYLVWSWPYKNKTNIFAPSEQEEKLFDEEIIEWADHEVLPVGDLSGSGTTDFLFYDENHNVKIAGSSADPVDGLEEGQIIGEEHRFINLDFSDITPAPMDYGDLTGNGYNDVLLQMNTEDTAGQLLVEGDSERDFEQTEIVYDGVNYSRTVREFAYNLGDISGNGLDDFALVVNQMDQTVIEIYQGGNGFGSPMQTIDLTDISSIHDITAGKYADENRRDIALIARYQAEEDDGMRLASEVRFYEGGSEIGQSPYHVIGDEQAYPEVAWHHNLIGTMITAGDVNNSGYDDILIGAPLRTDEDGNFLPVLLYEGGPDPGTEADHRIAYYKPETIQDGPGVWGFGNTLHALGDISGNGIDDFAIVNLLESLDQELVGAGHSGAVHLFYGQDGNEGEINFEEADLTLETNRDDARDRVGQMFLGFSDVAVGDFNGSGYNDIAVQTLFHNDQYGGRPGIHIYHGGPDMNSQPDHMAGLFNDIMAVGGHSGGYTSAMGHALMHGIPDLDGSGHDELLVIAGAGRYTNAVLLEGSDESVVEKPVAVFKAPLQHVNMGVSGSFINRQFKAASGDYTGDGFIDFVVTQPDDRNYRDTPFHLFSTGDVSMATEFDFRTDIRAEDEAENSIELTFGTSPDASDATDGIDQLAPPPPPGESFDARIVTGNDAYIRFYRPTTEGENEWEVQVQTGEEHYPVTLSWKAGDLADEGDFVLESADGSELLDMREEESFSIEDEETHTLTIRHKLDDTHIAGTSGLPGEFALNQNYPNPFNPVTQIGYDLPEQAVVTIEVFDILGRRVSTLVDEQQAAGRYEVTFDASNLSSGTYIYRIEAGGFVESKQMILVK